MTGADLQAAVRPVEEVPNPAPENATIPHLQMAGRTVRGNIMRLLSVTRNNVSQRNHRVSSKALTPILEKTVFKRS